MNKLISAAIVVATVLVVRQLPAEEFGGGDSFMDDSAKQECCYNECECMDIGWTFSADYLHWRLTNTNLDYARVEDGTAVEFGAGRTLYVPTDFDSGIRARIAHVSGNGWETALAYTHYQTSAFDAVTAGPLTVHPTRQHFANVPAAGVNSAEAAYSFDYDVIDVEMAKWIVFDCSTAMRLFGGFRYANIDQNLQSTYSRPGNVDVVSETNQVDAYGIRAGVEASRSLWGGFSISTRLAGSMLVGERNFRLLETQVAPAAVEVDLRDDQRFGLPVLEAAAAIDWCSGPFQFTVGYEIENWFNLASSSRSDLRDNGGQGGDDRFEKQTADIMLDGLFLRAAYNY